MLLILLFKERRLKSKHRFQQNITALIFTFSNILRNVFPAGGHLLTSEQEHLTDMSWVRLEKVSDTDGFVLIEQKDTIR